MAFLITCMAHCTGQPHGRTVQDAPTVQHHGRTVRGASIVQHHGLIVLFVEVGLTVQDGYRRTVQVAPTV